VANSRTLPDHATCATHEHYLLNCVDYEELLAESRGGCQICSFPAAQMPQQKLYIDHQGYEWAVRGLLCISCNSGIGNHDFQRGQWGRPDGASEYLANAWFLRKAAERGIDLADRSEPPAGTVTEDHKGIRWTTSGDGHWWPDRGHHRYRTWDQMYRHCGPLRLRTVAPEPALADLLSRKGARVA
jgi:hypothetical protein